MDFSATNLYGGFGGPQATPTPTPDHGPGPTMLLVLLVGAAIGLIHVSVGIGR
jgi:hypothetical protein